MSFDPSEFIGEFVTESREHLANIETDLLAIESTAEERDAELVNKVFRAVHSIKSTSGFLGLTAICDLSHELEHVLNLVRNDELIVTSEITDELLQAADLLRGLIEDVEGSRQADVSDRVQALHRLIEPGAVPAVSAAPDGGQAAEQASKPAFELGEKALADQRFQGHHLFFIELDLIADVHLRGKSPQSLIEEALSFGDVLDCRFFFEDCGTLEEEAPRELRFTLLIGTMLEEAGLVALAFDIPSERVHQISDEEAAAGAPAALTPPAKEHVMINSPVQTEPKTIPTEQACAPATGRPEAHELNREREDTHRPPQVSEPAAGSSKVAVETSIRVNVGLLDHLMNLAGELVLGRNQLMQAINATNRAGLDSVAARLDQVTSELQEAIMRTRMQLVATVFNKFPRIVRDLSQKLGKQCNLVIEGNDVELDKSIIEAISDPLTHLIRNAVDHGVEMPDVRLSKGKSREGTILLRAYHQSGKVNISISDDGAGINIEKLKKKAVERGILSSSEAREMSDREAARLVFHPGLSTAEQVTDVSGRGVGMDVVNTNIERLGGTVDITSSPAAGTTINVKLPLTLAIIPSLVVRCRDQRFAIPQGSINELVRIKASEVARRIERVKNVEVLRLRGSLLPLVRLRDALETRDYGALAHDRKTAGRANAAGEAVPESAAQGGAKSEDAVNIIVVEAGRLRYGLLVDGLHDSEEIVVKPLGRHMKESPCLAGATVLGDGRVALILDATGIAAHCELTAPDQDKEQARRNLQDALDEKQTVLLIRNDPKEQFAIPMALVSRIERIRADQIDTIGGQQVLQYRGTTLPLLSLEDHVRAKPRPDLSRLHVVVFNISRREVGLIVPTLVDIREVSTHVDIVTFQEPGVMGSMVVDQMATRLIDLFSLTEAAHPEWFVERKQEVKRTSTVPRILFAEDSGFFRKQVTVYLTESGFEVTACEDGVCAWQALEESEEPFDIVLTDIEMPNMNGLELSSRIKNDPRFEHLPIFALTSLAGESDLEKGRESGIDQYHIKLDRETLVEAITRQLGRGGTKGARKTAPVGMETSA